MDEMAFYIPYETVWDIPLDEFKNLHKQYWRFISDWRLDYKPSIYSSITRNRVSTHRCFACIYSKRRQDFYNYEHEVCTYCSLDCHCCELEPYKKWTFLSACAKDCSDKCDELYKYALQVSELNWTDRHKIRSYNGGE